MNTSIKRKIAVLIPCYNEALTIAKVINDFRRNLPDSDIYVYDNNSKDDTIALAKNAGAIVYSEVLQGKGNVVRRMFADIEADIYVMVDGDATYDADSIQLMVDTMIDQRLDMVTGVRKSNIEEAYRAGHHDGKCENAGRHRGPWGRSGNVSWVEICPRQRGQTIRFLR